MKFSKIPYERPDTAKIISESASIVSAVKNAKSVSDVMEQYKKFKKTFKNIYTMSALVYIRHTVDTRDEFYNKENDFIDETARYLKRRELIFTVK
ncbi:MAG: hypothetical protein FWD38_02825 [Oscillospiraceae bacterium]|nr:hypothetical protein [Oscillospiraceae bacterium]